ncbi:MAG: hypothetical protein QG621_5 [Patescibacteria group bacterium]|nr:hypothetical protein [Patescibacteria group bacterium]
MGGTLLYGACGAFAAGVAVALLTPVSYIFAFFVFALGIALLFFKRSNLFILLAITLVAFGVGVVRTNYSLQQADAQMLPNYIGTNVALTGRVVEDPHRSDSMTRAVLDDISIDGESVSGRLLIVLPADSAVSYNDQLFVQGKLKAPEAFETQTGHTFDYPNYLRAQGIRAHMSYAKLLDTKPSGFSMLGMLFSLKHAFEYSLDMLFPNPDNALLQGVLLGEKRGISQDITNAFIQSGLVHIVVLSGYNLSIVAEAVFRTLSFLPRAASFGVGGALMVFFALMTGAGAATVRALVMAIIALLARYLRRPHMALRALVVAASVMIVWNPLALLYDSSFILSVLATFGLITLSPWVEQLLIRKLPEFVLRSLGEQVRSIVATTLAVEIFVVPALLYFSGVLSLLSLPANALVLPIIPAAMLFGFLAGLLGLLHPLLGLLPAFIADVLLKWILLVAAVIASIPLSSVTLSQFSPWFLILAYIPLTWFAVKKYQFTVASSLRER